MTGPPPTDLQPASPDGALAGSAGQGRHHRGMPPASWIPSWGLITTKLLELRKRRGLMVVVAILTVGLPVLVLGIRLIFHAVDPASYGPAGSPDLFQQLSNVMAEFGFIAGAALGATAGASDLTDGVFRHLVVTGRSRLALFFARIPAGLTILLPLVAVAFSIVCLVTVYAGTSPSSAVQVNGVSIPAHLDEAQFKDWLLAHPAEAANALPPALGGPPGSEPPAVAREVGTLYSAYTTQQAANTNPPANQMVKIGLWIEVVVGVGFVVGLGLGSLLGQRTVSTVLLIVLEIIVTPILSAATIPYFLNGQRLVVGIALDQLRPAGLASGTEGGGGPRHVLLGGRGALGIPAMPTWAMVLVIVGWIVGWSAIGAWRMARRDA